MRGKAGEQHHKHLFERCLHVERHQKELSIKSDPLCFCRSINARKKALQAEKERAAKVASLPPPPPNPIQVIRR